MNKKIVSLGLLLLSAAGVSAQLCGDGYYRVQNAVTERYVYVLDDKGHINASTSSADLYAIKLYKNFERAAGDPATIIYLDAVGSEYDLGCQGTSVHGIIGYYMRLRANSDGTYYAYATSSGMTKYLGDAEQTSGELGYLTSEGKGEYRKWNLKPIDGTDGNYFGIKPVVSAGGVHYAPFYASFQFFIGASDIKAYYVSELHNDIAVLKEITDGIVPAATPVILACASADVSENRVNLAMPDKAVPTDNKLSGVYFQNAMNTHYNQKAYDASSMRILGTLEDGTLGFVTADADYIAQHGAGLLVYAMEYKDADDYGPDKYGYFLPANQAYLPVAAGAARELRLMTEEEFADGVNDVTKEERASHGVYSLSGVRLADDAASVDGLSSGVYIVNGKKVVRR